MNDLRKKMGKDPINIEFFDDLDQDEYMEARSKLENTSLYIYDHLGNSAMQNIMARMEYMAVSLGVDVIILITLLPWQQDFLGAKTMKTKASVFLLIRL